MQVLTGGRSRRRSNVRAAVEIAAFLLAGLLASAAFIVGAAAIAYLVLVR